MGGGLKTADTWINPESCDGMAEGRSGVAAGRDRQPPAHRVTLDRLPGIFRDPLRDKHGVEWPERRMWSEGGKAGVLRVCQTYQTEFEVAEAVGASPKAVRKQMRRYGISRWPKPQRDQGRAGR